MVLYEPVCVDVACILTSGGLQVDSTLLFPHSVRHLTCVDSRQVQGVIGDEEISEERF